MRITQPRPTDITRSISIAQACTRVDGDVSKSSHLATRRPETEFVVRANLIKARVRVAQSAPPLIGRAKLMLCSRRPPDEVDES
jgi:hypothetical protein